MGSYWSLSIADWHFCSGKSVLEPRFTSLFRATDRKTSRVTVDDLPNHEFEKHEYRASVQEMRDRLALMGFGIEAAKNDFNDCVQSLIDEGGYAFAGYGFELRPELLSFEPWCRAMRVIIDEKPNYPYDEYLAIHSDPLFAFILGNQELICGFPASDERYALRAVLELTDGDAEISYDFSDLVQGGYVSADDDHCQSAITITASEYMSVSNLILLTEGKFDAAVLKTSLSLLYPHLVGFFDVMDFTTAASPGGSSFLVHTVKAFAGSGVRNRIVALFDNDTEGLQAAAQLSEVKLAKNIRVMTLPDITIARSYPTVGPQGEVVMNINGLAASIELYLGCDVLGPNGSLTPIQWTGYNPKAARYQGEITDKAALQKRFREKVARVQGDGNIGLEEWSELRTLWESIFAQSSSIRF